MKYEYECCKSNDFTSGMQITKDEWLEYTTKKSSVTDDDCLCGSYGNCLAHENDYNTHREPNQPRRVYHKPKYPDEPLHLDKVFFGFIFIIILVSILYNMLN